MIFSYQQVFSNSSVGGAGAIFSNVNAQTPAEGAGSPGLGGPVTETIYIKGTTRDASIRFQGATDRTPDF